MYSLATFLELYPEIAHSDALTSDAIATAVRKCDLAYWGDDHKTACFLYAAHLLALKTMQMAELASLATAVAMSGKTGGRANTGNPLGAQRSAWTDPALEQTRYGQMYLSMLSERIPDTSLML